MVALADTYKPEVPSGPLSFDYGSAVAVEDDGAVADGLLSASAVCSAEQGRATFTGYIADNESGLLYARRRMYSPLLGRFVSRDPLGYIDGLSFYAAYFAPNSLDPFGYGDPPNLYKLLYEELVRQATKQLEKAYKQAREELTRQAPAAIVSAADAIFEEIKPRIVAGAISQLSPLLAYSQEVERSLWSALDNILRNYSHASPSERLMMVVAGATTAVAAGTAVKFAEDQTGLSVIPNTYKDNLEIDIYKGLAARVGLSVTDIRDGILETRIDNVRAHVDSYGLQYGFAALDGHAQITVYGDCYSDINVSVDAGVKGDGYTGYEFGLKATFTP